MIKRTMSEASLGRTLGHRTFYFKALKKLKIERDSYSRIEKSEFIVFRNIVKNIFDIVLVASMSFIVDNIWSL